MLRAELCLHPTQNSYAEAPSPSASGLDYTWTRVSRARKGRVGEGGRPPSLAAVLSRRQGVDTRKDRRSLSTEGRPRESTENVHTGGRSLMRGPACQYLDFGPAAPGLEKNGFLPRRCPVWHLVRQRWKPIRLVTLFPVKLYLRKQVASSWDSICQPVLETVVGLK